MKGTIAKMAAPLTGWLPDTREVPLRRQAFGAVAASIILHLLIFLGAGLTWGLFRGARPIGFVKPKPDLQKLEVVIALPEKEAERVSLFELQKRLTLDSTGLAKSDKAPENPFFESDQDMVAASEKPGMGSAPLPSQDGLRGVPFMNFATQDVRLGATTPPAAPQTPPAKALPLADSLYQPQPVAREPPGEPDAPSKMELPKVAKQTRAAEATPPPLPATAKAKRDEIPLVRESKPVVTAPPPLIPPPLGPRPIAQSEPLARPAVRASSVEPREQLARLTTPAPARAPGSSGFQPQLQQTRIEGALSNRGPAAVDAVRTPLGVYRKQLSEAIGSRWYYYVRKRMDLITVGTVQLNFSVDTAGRVRDIRVAANTSNASFAALCEQSVREAEIAPPPSDTFALMKNGRLDVPFTFTFYDPH